MTMKVGMLWFDDTRDRPLDDKIERAATYYREKYGGIPNVCYVHPSCLTHTGSPDQPIKVLSARDVLPHHFWIGVAEVAGERSQALTASG